MDILRVPQDKVTSRLERDELVESRARFLAEIATLLRNDKSSTAAAAPPMKAAASPLPPSPRTAIRTAAAASSSSSKTTTAAAVHAKPKFDLSTIYLHRASMLRYEEYGESGSVFQRDVVCSKCGLLWTPQDVHVKLWKCKRLPPGKLKRLQAKSAQRPWMLTRFQRNLLKQQMKMLADPYRLQYECGLCHTSVLIKLPATQDATGAVGRISPSSNIRNEGCTDSLNNTTSRKGSTKCAISAPAVSSGPKGGNASSGGSSSVVLCAAQGKSSSKKSRKSLLKQVTEMSEASKLRSPLQAFLTGL